MGPACYALRTEGEDGALGGEDEDGGGEELGDGGADAVRVHRVLAPPHREPPARSSARAHLGADERSSWLLACSWLLPRSPLLLRLCCCGFFSSVLSVAETQVCAALASCCRLAAVARALRGERPVRRCGDGRRAWLITWPGRARGRATWGAPRASWAARLTCRTS